MVGKEFESTTVQNFAVKYHQNSMRTHMNRYTMALRNCKSLVKAIKNQSNDEAKIKCTNYLKKLDRLNHSKKLNSPISLLEIIEWKEVIMRGEKFTKTFNYGRGLKAFQLHEVVTELEEFMDKVEDIFVEVCIENEVELGKWVIPELKGTEGDYL